MFYWEWISTTNPKQKQDALFRLSYTQYARTHARLSGTKAEQEREMVVVIKKFTDIYNTKWARFNTLTQTPLIVQFF